MEYLQYWRYQNEKRKCFRSVLNLIINGIPSILPQPDGSIKKDSVLNLIINGIPSIRKVS